MARVFAPSHPHPAWLDNTHQALDARVAAAYGWTDWTAQMPDEEILRRLLALNLERTGTVAQAARPQDLATVE